MQGVLLAHYDYSSLSSLVSTKPNASLPIGNKPVTWFSLNVLDQAGITDVIIICQEETQYELKSSIESCDSGLLKRLKATFYTIPSTINDPGSLNPDQCLALIRDKLNSNLICIISALLVITDANILNDILIMMSRTGATMVSVYSRFPKDASKSMKSLKEGDVLFLEPHDTGNSRLLRILPVREFGSGEGALVKIPQAFIDRYKCVKTMYKMLEAHLYVMRKSLVDYFISRKKEPSTKSFLRKFINVEQHDIQSIPSSLNSKDESDDPPNDINSLLEEYYPSYKSSTTIHAFVQEQGDCFRINNLVTYSEINRLLLSHTNNLLSKPLICSQLDPNVTVDKHSYIGVDCSLSKTATIDCSVISAKCHIGEGCKIIKSILLEGAHIADGCNVMNCVIGQGASIGDKSRLQECYVANKQKLPSKSQFVGEQLGFSKMN